jgi:uncharacterized protein (TIGR02271 family)
MVGERSEYSGREVVDVIEGGVELYTADGDRVGDVLEISPEFLVVDGGMFDGERFISRSAVERTEGNSYYLNVGRDQLDSIAFTERPGSGSDTYATQDYTTTEQSVDSYRTSTDDYQTSTPTDTADSATIRVHEEELQATKGVQQVGEVQVRKDVVEEQRTLNVPVTREEVEVTRRVVDRDVSGTDSDAFQEGETIRVPIREEVVEVTKTPRVVEELEIRKVAQQETQTVTDTVRKEVVDVDETGNAREIGTTTDRDRTSTDRDRNSGF